MLALWQDGGGTLWRGQYKGATAGLRAASATTWSLLISTASIAASLRSTCGPARKAPESCTQAFPVATPHRGHGTPDNCFAVMSLIRIGTACNKPNRQAVRNGTHCLSSVAAARPCGFSPAPWHHRPDAWLSHESAPVCGQDPMRDS